jgi:hypothetical protein
VETRLARFGVSVATPREDARRGGHLALVHSDASRVCRALRAAGVIPDFRPPDIIRLAPVPLYTRFADCWEAVCRLEIDSGRKAPRAARRWPRNRLMTIYDISRPLDAARLAGWPGDTPFAFSLAWRQDEGASVNVGRVTMSVHTGTHVDAPFHFDADGPTIDRLPLGPFVGPACVLDVSEAAAATGLITPDDLAPAVPLLGDAPRLLLRTDAWPDSARFP